MELEGVEVERPLKLHFIPFLAPGHMIPLADIAAMFASHGQQVTIITTSSNAHFYINKSMSSVDPSFFRLQTIDFPSEQVGLPDSVECLSSTATSVKIFTAAMLLHGPIQDFIEKDPPDCIIAACVYPWVDDMASQLQIPTITFTAFPLFSTSLIESIRRNRLLHSHMDSDLDSGSFVVDQGFPHHFTLCTKPPKEFTRFMEMMLEKMLKCKGLIVNSFIELDGEECIEHYKKTMGHEAWHLGPTSLINRTVQENAKRGEESDVSVHECLSWLNSKQVSSMMYICFGSNNYFSDKQLYEIVCGIEASDHKFVWVIPEKKGKEDQSDEEKGKWLPKGFEERNIGKKSLIIRGWAPQILILSHPAVGAFMTHCGWNSTVEAVGARVPMIMWPVHSEQFYNEKLVTDVRGIRVEVGPTEWCLDGFSEKKKLVSRDSIEQAVRRLMDGGDEVEEIRRRAQEFGKNAMQAVEDGGSSYNKFLTLIDNLKRLRDNKPVD